MSKILLTAFEPFGPIGKYIRRENSSEQILEDIKARNPDGFHFLTLPVSDDGIVALKLALETLKPSGVICMGENLLTKPDKIKIEPFAYDTKASAYPDLGLAFKNKVRSPFAGQIAPDENSTIGNYYCNQAYLQSLKWAARNGNPPVIFIHTPVFGSHTRHADQVLNSANQMIDFSNTPPSSDF